MTSKERFKMGESDVQGEMAFIDTETNTIYQQEYFDEIVDLVNEQQGIIEDKNNVIILMGAFIKSKGLSIDDFNEWIKKKAYFNVEVVNLLNDKLSIIRKDEIYIKAIMSNMEKLEKENEQLINKLGVANARSGYYQKMLKSGVLNE